ncbi:ABC transporter ATP-binding protein [Streptomyces sp. NPDC050211]|uniref:ABC transporter ATP-binding protein n=1 Tax=Streptomyces sp. NPDC050211 TaxID=3154932 RepID=UPI00341B647D
MSLGSTAEHGPTSDDVNPQGGSGDRDPTAPNGGALAELLSPVRGRLTVAVVLQALSALASVVPFVAVAELGRVLLEPGGVNEGRAWAVALAGASALLLRLLFLTAAGGISHYADNDLQLDLRRRLADRLGRVPLGWYDGTNSGSVKKSLQDDVSAMHHLVAHSLLDLTSALVVPLASLAYLFWVDWRMALVTMAPLVVGMALYARTMSGYAGKMASYDDAMRRINSSVVEFVQGISVVKTFGQSGRAHRRFITATEDFARFFLGWMGGLMRLSAVTQVVLSPVTVLLVVLSGGALLIDRGLLTPVDLLPFALLGLGLTAPLQALEFSGNDLQLATVAAGRVRELLNTPELPPPSEPATADGDLAAFHQVRFAYREGDDVLHDVDLALEPGTVTALVGPSGSGKSTLAKLLPRFFDVTGGRVSVGGADVRQLASSELYGKVGFVFQDVRMLRTSVRDNIRLGVPDADDERVVAAARAAQIHERILQLPRGYDSVIGDDAMLSGGELQRVSIARALLVDSGVLVLDEATAYADPESEAAIQLALSELARDRTLLVIAHRLATVVEADLIVLLDGGRITEQGRHEELLAAGGRYAEMWRAHQSASEELAPTGRPHERLA